MKGRQTQLLLLVNRSQLRNFTFEILQRSNVYINYFPLKYILDTATGEGRRGIKRRGQKED